MHPDRVTRRHILAAGGTAAPALAGAGLAGAVLSACAAAPAVAAPESGPAGVRPGLEWVFTARVTVGAPIEGGIVAGERRRTIPITGGEVSGPRFRGVVLPGGADWQTIRSSDGNTRIWARYSLRHEDGTVVGVTNPGVRRGPPEVMKRLAAGETVDPALYYFRASPQFEVAEGPHGWLMENTFVCMGKRWPDVVELDVYCVT